jgi:NAD-dependent DNA ligase
MTIEGFQEKLSSKIYNSIKSKLQNATLVKIMSSSNIFGHGMAERKLDLIMKAEPQILNSTELDQIKIEKIAKIKGMATKTAELFVKNISDFLNFLDETKLTYKLDDATKELIHEDKANEDHVLYGKNIVMTGFRDVELSILIEKHGARITNGVNKKTFAVIVKEKDFSSAKTEQAQSFNIPIMLIEEFKTKFL